MKKFLLKTALFGLYVVLIQVIFPVVIDPFNVFHPYSIRSNGIEPNKNYVKMKYILHNPNKFTGFMFGSSRVGAIHSDKIPGEKIYNMTYSAGLPSEHLRNIKTFIENNIRPSVIYIGLDSYSYTDNIKDHISEALRCPYEYLYNDFSRFYSLYFDVIMVRKSLKIIRKNYSPSADNDIFYEYGWTSNYGRVSNFDWDSGKAAPSVGRHFSREDLTECLKDIHEISEVCAKNGIRLILFTNPMHHITYSASVQDKEYLAFLEGLAEISEFYNFSSLNDITLDNNNYYETSHYKAEVGDMILNVICSGEVYPELYAQGFGVKVTKDSSKDFINMLEIQAENFRQKCTPAE